LGPGFRRDDDSKFHGLRNGMGDRTVRAIASTLSELSPHPAIYADHLSVDVTGLLATQERDQ
jgi:hypothetical protein